MTLGQILRHASSTDVHQGGSAGDGPRACWRARSAREHVMASVTMNAKRTQLGWGFWLQWMPANTVDIGLAVVGIDRVA
jgi:hypothetical protein